MLNRLLILHPKGLIGRLSYVLLATAIAQLLGLTTYALFLHFGLPKPSGRWHGYISVIAEAYMIVIAPLLETGVMALLFWLARKLKLSEAGSVFICAGLMALGH